MTDTIKLNIGGTIFETSQSTLMKFDGYFKRMLENGIPVPEDVIFIDRSPKHFDLILNFMRDGHVDLRKYSEDVSEIQKEAEYYLLDGLIELCAQQPRKMPYVVETDNDMFKFVAESTKNAVMVFIYDSEPWRLGLAMELFMKWKNQVDFCFKKHSDDRKIPYYVFHDKINNRVTSGPISNTSVPEQDINDCFGNRR
ncbi:unnamed protein product [Caenorhabditis nigoni]